MSTTAKFLRRVSEELGFTTLMRSHKDVHLIMLTRFARMFAYGSSTLILALYFAELGFSDTMIGLFMTLTLIGDLFISLALIVVADKLGRRRILIVGALLMTFSGAIFATNSNYWVLLVAAIIGVISPGGNEIGPFRAVEESTIAHLTDAATRSDIFALYVVGGTLGSFGGALIGGWVIVYLQRRGWDVIEAYRFIFWIYAIVGLVKAAVSLLLSKACERDHEPAKVEETEDSEGPETEEQPLLGNEHQPNGNDTDTNGAAVKKEPWIQLSNESRKVLIKLCGLFFFDSLASGMTPMSLVSYFISLKFGISQGKLGTIISVMQLISSLGNIFASSVARRIGLVATMVFTHLPSAIFLALIPAPNALWLTIVILIARSSLNAMDQAPRSAFLSAVVLPEERTAVLGICNTVKTLSQSAGPLITGVLSSNHHFWVAFVIAGALKASYDVAMLKMFANIPLEGDRDANRSDEDGSANDQGSNGVAGNPSDARNASEAPAMQNSAER